LDKLRPDTGAVIATYNLGSGFPTRMAFDGSSLWIIEPVGYGVLKVRVADGVIVASYPLPNLPQGIVFDGANVWITQRGQGGVGSVVKMRASDGLALGTFSAGVGPCGIVYDGANIWITTWDGNQVLKLRATGGSLLDTLSDPGACGLAFDGANVWVSNFYSGTISKM
jgi:hypothetical protein